MDLDPAVAQVQRKIELQATDDFTYLVANVRRAAAARIDEAFPHLHRPDAREDPLRSQIETLVNEYITRTFHLAADNISINGLPVAPSILHGDPSVPITEYEPFDGRKRRRVADLIAAEEKLLEEVAALKRSIPPAAAAQQAAQISEALQRDEALFQQGVAQVTASNPNADSLGPPELERQAVVEASFARAVDSLGQLKRDLPAVVAKMERAVEAGEYAVKEMA